MKPKAVVWDIDDVLTPTSETFYQTALNTHGSCPHPDHWSDYLWGKHINMNEGLETQQYLIDQQIIERSEPYSYTVKALTTTARAGYKNILLSARAWHPHPADATTRWATHHGIDSLIEAMHFVKVDEAKSVILSNLLDDYDIKAFVEDNPVHAKACPVIIPHVYLVRRSWNKECQTNPRFHCVSTALDAAILIRLLTK